VDVQSNRVPRFAIGDGYAMYRGPAPVSTLHRHAAFQIVIGTSEPIVVVDGANVRHRSTAVVVPPMQRHHLMPAGDVLTYFIEPHSVLGVRLRRRYDNRIAADRGLRELSEDEVQAAGVQLAGELDPRLLLALNALLEQSLPVPAVAATVGMSPQRLRALARQQLGMPLSRWRVWTRLRRAAQAMQGGQSLAEAAIAAGFSDQAHLTRQMRQMMGLTPAAVLPILRCHSLPAT
jgi:AraC-like DNA-binding protein